MKKLIVIATASIFLLILTIIGCKKEGSQKAIEPPPLTNQKTMPLDNIKVSSRGFLVFPKLKDFNNYLAFLQANTPAKVQAYLDSLGFYSLRKKHSKQARSSKKGSGAAGGSRTFSEDDLSDLILNEDGVVQVENAILKPITEKDEEVTWQFLLTMMPQYLSDVSYAELIAGTYDPTVMNQFATNPDNESLNLFDFIEQTPVGYQETIANSTLAMRPMFGHGDWTSTGCGLDPDPNNWLDFNGDGIADPTYIQTRHRRTFMFWIGVGWDNDSYPAYSCN